MLPVRSRSELETSNEARRAGFREIAVLKSAEAENYLAEARALIAAAAEHGTPGALVASGLMRNALAEAAGISVKATSHIEDVDVDCLIKEFVISRLVPKMDLWVDELVHRYLLARGDALGGRMRNLVGEIAERKFCAALVDVLLKHQYSLRVRAGASKEFVECTAVASISESTVKTLRWSRPDGARRELLFNSQCKLVDNKNIDVLLLGDFVPTEVKGRAIYLSNAANYLAAGELKGGIDPAGADEHWKTAGTHLNRIRTAFGNHSVSIRTFFIGGAIEASMAGEIYEQLVTGELDCAANLTVQTQLTAICEWICGL